MVDRKGCASVKRAGVSGEALVAFLREIATGLEAGTLERPGWIEFCFANREAVRLVDSNKATEGRWESALRETADLLEETGVDELVAFAFALTCGCSMRMEVGRG